MNAERIGTVVGIPAQPSRSPPPACLVLALAAALFVAGTPVFAQSGPLVLPGVPVPQPDTPAPKPRVARPPVSKPAAARQSAPGPAAAPVTLPPTALPGVEPLPVTPKPPAIALPLPGSAMGGTVKAPPASRTEPRKPSGTRAEKPARPLRNVRAEPPPPPPPLTPVGDVGSELLADVRPFAGRPSAFTSMENEAARRVTSETINQRIGLMFDPVGFSPSTIPVYDAGLSTLEIADAAPLALNSFESVQAGQPAGPYRAGLIEDVDGPAERVRVNTGTVVWTMSPNRAPGGGPASITADITVPKLSLRARFELRPEAAAPPGPLAMELTITSQSLKVTQIGVPEMRATGADRGVPLFGRAAGTPQTFQVLLSSAQIDGDQNVRLLVDRPWVDIPLRLSTGKRVTLAFEKGAIVRDMLRGTFREWRLPWLP